MIKRIYVWFFVLVYCVYRIQGRICGSGQKFGVLKSCQRTCGHKKPLVCLPRPRCYCEDKKIWDSKQNRCVYPYECIDKISGQYGIGFGGGGEIYGGEGGSNGGKSLETGFSGEIVHRGGETGEVGGTSSFHRGGSFSVSGFLKDILSLPIKIPADVLKTIRTVIWNIVSFNFKALRTSFNGVKGITGYVTDTFRNTFARIFYVFLKIGSVNADVVVGIINHVKGGIGWIIRTFASFNIDIIQIISNIAVLIRNRADSIVGSGIKAFAFVLEKAGDGFNGGVKILPIKQILQLPIIRTIVSIITTIQKTGLGVVFEQLKEAEAFIFSIISEHQDFFIPIFNTVLNTGYAIFSTSHKIAVGSNAKDLSFHIGKAGFGVKPDGSWQITGSAGQIIGEGGPDPLKNTSEGNENSGYESTGTGALNGDYGGINGFSGSSYNLGKYSGSSSGSQNTGGGGGSGFDYGANWNTGTNSGSQIFGLNPSLGKEKNSSGSVKDKSSESNSGSKYSYSSSGSDNQNVFGSNYDLTSGGFNFGDKDSGQNDDKKQGSYSKFKGKTSGQFGSGKKPGWEKDSSEEKFNSKSQEGKGSVQFGFGKKSQGRGKGGKGGGLQQLLAAIN